MGFPSDQFIGDDRRVASVELSISALNKAESRIGRPYYWGAKGPDYFDCSGLISWAYEAADPSTRFETPDSLSKEVAMQDMYDLNVLHVDRNHVQPGDIVFITSDSNRISHGGLFVKWLGRDEFSFVDASSYYGKVVMDSFSVSGYVRGQWLVGFGRLLQRRHQISSIFR